MCTSKHWPIYSKILNLYSLFTVDLKYTGCIRNRVVKNGTEDVTTGRIQLNSAFLDPLIFIFLELKKSMIFFNN